MLKNIFSYYLLLSSPFLFCQVIANPSYNFGYLNFEDCESDQQSRDFLEAGYLELAGGIELGTDGQLYLLTNAFSDSTLANGEVIPVLRGAMVAEYDYRNDIFRDTVFTDFDKEWRGYTALGSRNNGNLTIIADRSFIEINPTRKSVLRSNTYFQGIFQAGVTWIADTLYGTGSFNGTSGVLAFDDIENLDTLRLIDIPSLVIGAISTQWSEDCSELLLVTTAVERISSTRRINYVQLRNSGGQLISESCPYIFDQPPTLGFFWGFASYDNYLNVCELRLDLDTDNSGSRFGPHFWQDARCTRSYPVADDVTTRSLVGTLDSVTVKLRAAGRRSGDELRFPATDRLTVRAYGDSLVHLVANELTTNTDFTNYLPGITLEVTADVIETGERIVEAHAYAGGLQSDQARTFIQVAPTERWMDAGQDATVFACNQGRINLFERLGPEARPGGTWLPELIVRGIWDPNVHDYGTYRYVVPADDCPADTAYVTVSLPRPFKHLLPVADSSIALCPGKTFNWTVDIPEVGGVLWEDGSTRLTRKIMGAGFYTGTVTDNGGCFVEDIFLKVSDATAGASTNALERFCVGDTILLEDGFTLTFDTTIITTFDMGLTCDSTHRTIYRFRPEAEVMRLDTICPGDTLFVADQLFAAPGEYELALPDGPCGTLLSLSLTVIPPDTVYLDTTLQAGEILVIEGITYDTAGSYVQYSSNGGACGRILNIDLDFMTSTANHYAQNDIWHPTLLRSGYDRLTFHPYVPGDVVTLEKLEILNLRGQRIYASVNLNEWRPDVSLTTGVYVFRAQLKVNGRVRKLTGKLVVSR